MELEELGGKWPKRMYLASPYSDDSRIVMKRRFEQICFHAGTLMSLGVIVFSPIAHTHPICVANQFPRDYSFWEKFDRAFVTWCQVFVVCGMEGWQESTGVNGEFNLATEIGRDRYLWNLETGLLEPLNEISK